MIIAKMVKHNHNNKVIQRLLSEILISVDSSNFFSDSYRFLLILLHPQIFLQILAYSCIFLHIPANSCRFLQILADSCRFLQIPADSCRFLQIPSDFTIKDCNSTTQRTLLERLSALL